LINFNGSIKKNEVKRVINGILEGTHKIVLFRKSLVTVVKKKDMELDEIKYLYLFILPLLVVFSILLRKSKERIWDLELIKLSPDRSVLNLF
jgi:hypothetical protein